MGWSGGVFTRARNWAQDKLNTINPQAALFDQEDDNFATGLNNTLTRDGTTSPTANISWGNFKITSLGDASSATDAMNQQSSDLRYASLFTNRMFSAQRITSSQSMTASTVTTCIFNNEAVDTGSNYDNTTGIFTTPATGFYMFTVLAVLIPGGTNCVLNGIYFSVNNATAGTVTRIDIGYGVTAAQYSNTGNNVFFTGSIILSLTVTDTVRVKWDAGSSGAGTNALAITSQFTGMRLR